MKKVCFINGSPKGVDSSSFVLIKEIEKMMGNEDYHKFRIHVASRSKENVNTDFSNMLDSDILIITFPLYYYALPGVLTGFLEGYYKYARTLNTHKQIKVYAVINCGFPEPSHNDTAVQIIENFCSRLNLDWRFAAEIGMGGIIKGTETMPMNGFLKSNIYNGLKAIYTDIQKNEHSHLPNIHAKARFPNWLYLFQGNRGWLTMAKKNGLTKNDLARTPYVKKRNHTNETII